MPPRKEAPFYERSAMLLLILLLLALPVLAQNDFVEALQKDYSVPGAAVAIVKDGQVVLLKGYGLRRAGTDLAVDPDTVFALASLTKPFTSATLATLVQEGKLEWDRPARDYLPELQLAEAFPTAQVTLRDFLCHRSGLPAFTGDLFDSLGYPRDEVVRRIRHMPLSAGFRERSAYSNVGFFLAGMAGARVEGLRWEDQVTRRVLQPLGMTRTGFFNDPITPASNVAYPHLLAGGKLTSTTEYDPQTVLAPAGEMSSSIRDLATFALMQLGEGKLLSAATLEELHRPSMVAEVSFSEGPPIDAHSGFAFGLGWDNYHFNGCEVVEKAGARYGVRSIITLVPSRRLGVVVLCNLNATFFPEAVRAHVLEQYLGKSATDLKPVFRERQAQIDKMMSSLGTPLPKPVAALTRPLDAYCGVYTNPLYGQLTVARRGEGLTWSLGPAAYSAPLVASGYDTFWQTFPAGRLALPDEFTFTLDPQGKAQSVSTGFGVFVLDK